MIHRATTVHFLASLALGLSAPAALAQGPEIPLDLHIKPQLFQSQFVTSDGEQLQAATLGSGLDLNLSNSLFDVDMDYRLESQLRAEQSRPGESFSQQFKARLHSNILNEAFGVDAGFTTDSLLTNGVQQHGYGVTLDGSLNSGRLNWSGSWRADSIEEDASLLTRFTEVFDLKSSYKLAKSLLLELSSEFRQERKYYGHGEDLSNEERYGAAVSWSPSRQYSLAFKVNNHNNAATNQQETFGSGSISWLPRRNLEFTLDYGDQLVEGASGWMLHTRFDIEG